MTDTKDDSARTDGDGGLAKRPSAIIDAKATPVEDEPPRKDEVADDPLADPTASGQIGERGGDTPGGQETSEAPRRHGRPTVTSLLTHLAAGLAGGFLVFVTASAFAPQSGPTDEAADRVAALDRRLKAIETSAESRASVPSAEFARKLAAAEQRLARLEEIGRNLSKVSETQAKLASEAKALEERLGKLGAVENAQARLAEIEGKLKVLSATDRSMDGRGAEQIAKELAGLKAETGRLAQRVQALQASDERFEPALQALQEETGQLKGDLARELKSVARAQDVTRSLTPLGNRLSALEQGLDGLAKSEHDRNVNAERIVLALELGNLKRVVERGVPYANELAEVKKVSGGKLNLSVLERYKGQGVPPVTELAREFRGLAHAIIDAQSEQPDASILDRLLAGAKSIVRVRRVSHSAGDNGVEAVVARMEASVNQGNLALVIEEAKHLSPKAKTPARSWLEKVEARSAVERAIGDIDAELKASLGAGTQAGRKG